MTPLPVVAVFNSRARLKSSKLSLVRRKWPAGSWGAEHKARNVPEAAPGPAGRLAGGAVGDTKCAQMRRTDGR